MKLLIKCKSYCIVNASNSNKETALILACKNKMNNVAKHILVHYYKYCNISQMSKYGVDALYYANLNNMYDVVNLINNENQMSINKPE